MCRGLRPVAGQLWLVAIMTAGILLAIGVQPAMVGGRPLVTGVAGLGTDDPLAFQHVRATGAQLVHIPIRWGGIAPRKQPGAWNPRLSRSP